MSSLFSDLNKYPKLNKNWETIEAIKELKDTIVKLNNKTELLDKKNQQTQKLLLLFATISVLLLIIQINSYIVSILMDLFKYLQIL